MAKKNVRNMKVCGQSGYKYEMVPAITWKGKWLEELGFHLGNYVQVKCENGQLIITPDVNKTQEQEAKTAFMDEEIKKLKIRYQNEKEKITAKYVWIFFKILLTWGKAHGIVFLRKWKLS